jgi:predicted TPR repeat methyltransferase
MIVAADVLIYIGNLERAFKAVATALRPHGWFAFDTETMNGVNYEIQGNGRFAHANGYIQMVGRQYFEVMESTEMVLRQEAGKPIRGTTSLLRKS